MKKIFVMYLFFFSYFSIFANQKELFFGADIEGFPIQKSQLESIQSEFGIPPSIYVFFLMWPKKDEMKKMFHLTQTLHNIDSKKAIPCITWEPMYLENEKEKVILKEEIINGSYDNYLDEFSFQIAAFKKPVIIRFAHEMNLSRYHWGVDEYNENAPKIYIEIYRYVVDYFKKKKVNNAFFAFCPNVDSVPANSWNEIENYYPGDSYVNILGMDGYNWGLCSEEKKLGWTSSWKSFNDIFLKTYHKLKKLSLFKPIIIFETASSNLGGDKTKWLDYAIEEAKKLDILAICWFQVDKECLWKITPDQKSILKKYFFDSKYLIDDYIEETKQ